MHPIEIEQRLLQHPEIIEVVVATHQRDETGEPYVIAWCRTNRGINVQALRGFALDVLPADVDPLLVIQVDEFPLTLDGAIDVERLIALMDSEVAQPSHKDAVAPNDGSVVDIEGPILDYLGELLDIEVKSMSIDDDFFDLGGTSVDCLDLFMWIEERFGVELPLSTITTAPTVRLLVGIVDEQRKGHVSETTKSEPLPEQWEWVLCLLWSEILHVPEVKPRDNVFDLGAVASDVQCMTEQLRDIYGIVVTPFDVDRAPTIVQLAALTRGRSTRSCLVPLNINGSKTPFFCIAGLAGLALAFLPLARGLGSDQPFYALQAHGIDRRGLPDYTIRRTATRYVKSIRSVQPHGPYLIGGHSYGGLIALEVVHQLAAEGEEVALLLVFDTILPERLVTEDGPISAKTKDRTSRVKWLPYQPAIRLGTILRLPAAGLIRLRGYTQYEAFGLIGRIQVRLAKPLRPWTGPAVVFVSNNNPYENDILTSWGRLLMGTWSRVSASGDHLSMMQRPHATRLAQTLKGLFAKALDTESSPTVTEGVDD
jgi:thioesterase domain-containing protein/acyl carrier protein